MINICYIITQFSIYLLFLFFISFIKITGARQLPWWSRSNRNGTSGRGNITIKQSADSIRGHPSNAGVWTWLSNRRPSGSPEQIGPASASPAENHYTHMDDAYSPVGVGDEALYAELDRESIRSGNPSYQNTAYSQCGGEADQDVPIVSSAPSSAYYSDLSTTGTATDRAYEVVGLTHLSSPMPNWEAAIVSDGSGIVVGGVPGGGGTIVGTGTSSSGNIVGAIVVGVGSNGRRPPRLAAITESTTTVPSDYV